MYNETTMRADAWLRNLSEALEKVKHRWQLFLGHAGQDQHGLWAMPGKTSMSPGTPQNHTWTLLIM